VGAATLTFSGWLVYLKSHEGLLLPPSSALRALHPLHYMSFVVVVVYSVWVVFSFFPRWGSVCPGGYSDLAQGCLWEYHLLLSTPGGLLLLSQ
jgi:hypothetical protein